MMKYNTPFFLLLSIFLLKFATAHTYLSSINGLSEFDCIRPERPTYERNSPIVDITAGDMTCGWLPYASQPANRKCPVTAGDSITLQFFHDGPYADDFIIDSSHRGPCILYMAAATTGTPQWFKVWEQGLDSSNKFCVDYLRSDTGVNGAGKGRLKFQIPKYLPTGNYLLRTEIIALHEGYAIGKAQFYINCVELYVTNSAFTASAVNVAAIPTVRFPGTYSTTDPGIFYNLYGSYLPAYTIPGPSVFNPSTVSPPSTPVTSAPVTSAPVTSAPVTSAPVTSAPVTPSPTTKPPTAPITTPPTPGGSGEAIHIQVHASSTVYWLAIRIIGPSTETIKVELTDSGSFSSWTAFSNTNWGYFVFGGGQVTLPVSLRLTNVNNKVVTLTSILSAVVPGATISTTSSYDGSSTSPSPSPVTPAPATYAPVTPAPATYAPVTPAPATYAPVTAAPTSKPNAPPTAGPVTSAPGTTKVQVHAGSSQWWFAVAILDTGSKTVASVQVLDATDGSTYINLAPTDWAYWVYQTSGKPLIAPLSIRITSTVGNSIVVSNVPVTAAVINGPSML